MLVNYIYKIAFFLLLVWFIKCYFVMWSHMILYSIQYMFACFIVCVYVLIVFFIILFFDWGSKVLIETNRFRLPQGLKFIKSCLIRGLQNCPWLFFKTAYNLIISTKHSIDIYRDCGINWKYRNVDDFLKGFFNRAIWHNQHPIFFQNGEQYPSFVEKDRKFWKYRYH